MSWLVVAKWLSSKGIRVQMELSRSEVSHLQSWAMKTSHGLHFFPHPRLEWRWQRQLCKSPVGESKPWSAWVPEWSHRLCGIPVSHSSLILPQHVQFSSVAQSCLNHCDPMNCSTPGLPVHHQLPELTQTHVHWVGNAIQPSHPLSSPSPALNLSQNQGLFQWVSFSHQMAKVLER